MTGNPQVIRFENDSLHLNVETLHGPEVLLKGMSSEKHFSLPERQKYFPASSPLAIVPTLLL